jgi:hypothetical protein
VSSLEPEQLRNAHAAAMRALVDEGKEANLPTADVVAQRLAELR